MSLLPPDDHLELLHTRNYEVKVYMHGEDHVMVRGVICDRKPPGLYIADDELEMEMHRMQVELHVRIADMVITHAQVGFETFPHHSCPGITGHYEKLVGLSIARGFTHKVRELFGGPRGCSHTTALLQAMAPIAMQSGKSIECIEAERRGEPNPIIVRPPNESWKVLTNTCHVWAEDGPRKEEVERGGVQTIPVDVRLAQLGREPRT